MAYDVVRKKVVAGDWCCGIGDDVGSIALSSSDRTAVLNKVDDLRYDVRRAGALAGAGLAALAGAVALVGVSGIWRVVKGERKH